MKKIKVVVVLFFLGFVTLQAQINKPVTKIPRKTPNLNLSTNLNLETIKGHIKANTYCYTVNLTSTAIIPPQNPQVLKAVDAYYSQTRYLKVEREYLRTNGLLVRSDKQFNRNQGNNYEVLIYPERANKRNIDKNQVKITWRTPEKGLKTFNLKNVSIQYKPYGILIIGDYEIDGMIFGVSIGLKPETCLI